MGPVLQFFAPEVADHTTRSHDITWQFGRNSPRRIIRDAIGNEIEDDGSLSPPKPVFQLFSLDPFDSVNACVASPRGYNALCIAATGAGLRAIDLAKATSVPMLDMNQTMIPRMYNEQPGVWSYIEDPSPGPPYGHAFQSRNSPRQQPFRVLAMKRQKRLGEPKLSADNSARFNSIFSATSVDFVHQHPYLLVAAGRHPVPWLVDLRDPSWHAFGDTSMVETYDASIRIDGRDREHNVVTHARSAGEHHVVAASLKNKMLMYDLRYMKNPKSSREEDVVAAALFRFRNYHKSTRTAGLGFAVDAELGLVAAGEEHDYYTGLGGGLSLYSLATGERLHAPGLQHVSHSPERLARIYTPSEALLTLPRTPSGATTLSASSIPSSISSSPEPAFDPFVTVATPRSRKYFTTWAEKVAATQPMPFVGALSFAALPRERTTSLLAGIKARVHKFSLKQGPTDVFYGEDEEDWLDDEK